jgi:hypothetical protein
MRFKDLGISIKFAERLYDLGVRFDSVLYWYEERPDTNLALFIDQKYPDREVSVWKLNVGKPSHEKRNIYKEVSAYCCNELGEMLPGFIEQNGTRFYLQFKKHEKKWEYYYIDNSGNELINASANNEHDARAKLLIKAIEDKYIDVSQTIIK